jgi:hypothetical protein
VCRLKANSQKRKGSGFDILTLCRLHVPLEHVPHFDLVAVGALRGSLKVDLVVGCLVRGSVELDLELLKILR